MGGTEIDRHILSSLLRAAPIIEGGVRRRTVRLGIAIAVGLTVAGAVISSAARHAGDKQARSGKTQTLQTKKSQSQLVAGNYKVLTRSTTQRLLRYAEAAYACLSKRLPIAKPRSLRSKIVLALPVGVTPSTVARESLKCAQTIGDPPSDASFQVRGQAVILYLPKYCILDKKVVALSRATPDH